MNLIKKLTILNENFLEQSYKNGFVIGLFFLIVHLLFSLFLMIVILVAIPFLFYSETKHFIESKKHPELHKKEPDSVLHDKENPSLIQVQLSNKCTCGKNHSVKNIIEIPIKVLEKLM